MLNKIGDIFLPLNIALRLCAASLVRRGRFRTAHSVRQRGELATGASGGQV